MGRIVSGHFKDCFFTVAGPRAPRWTREKVQGFWGVPWSRKKSGGAWLGGRPKGPTSKQVGCLRKAGCARLKAENNRVDFLQFEQIPGPLQINSKLRGWGSWFWATEKKVREGPRLCQTCGFKTGNRKKLLKWKKGRLEGRQNLGQSRKANRGFAALQAGKRD